jgi:hypothetical protein
MEPPLSHQVLSHPLQVSPVTSAVVPTQATGRNPHGTPRFSSRACAQNPPGDWQYYKLETYFLNEFLKVNCFSF